jgi:hypothetical protein
VAITVMSIAQQATNLQAQVTALQNAGVLNRGQATALTAKLSLPTPYDKGVRGNAAVANVRAFLNQVRDLLNAGILTQAQADALLGPGQILLLGLTVEFGG